MKFLKKKVTWDTIEKNSWWIFCLKQVCFHFFDLLLTEKAIEHSDVWRLNKTEIEQKYQKLTETVSLTEEEKHKTEVVVECLLTKKKEITENLAKTIENHFSFQEIFKHEKNKWTNFFCRNSTLSGTPTFNNFSLDKEINKCSKSCSVCAPITAEIINNGLFVFINKEGQERKIKSLFCFAEHTKRISVPSSFLFSFFKPEKQEEILREEVFFKEGYSLIKKSTQNLIYLVTAYKEKKTSLEILKKINKIVCSLLIEEEKEEQNNIFLNKLIEGKNPIEDENPVYVRRQKNNHFTCTKTDFFSYLIDLFPFFKEKKKPTDVFRCLLNKFLTYFLKVRNIIYQEFKLRVIRAILSLIKINNDTKYFFYTVLLPNINYFSKKELEKIDEEEKNSSTILDDHKYLENSLIQNTITKIFYNGLLAITEEKIKTNNNNNETNEQEENLSFLLSSLPKKKRTLEENIEEIINLAVNKKLLEKDEKELVTNTNLNNTTKTSNNKIFLILGLAATFFVIILTIFFIFKVKKQKPNTLA